MPPPPLLIGLPCFFPDIANLHEKAPGLGRGLQHYPIGTGSESRRSRRFVRAGAAGVRHGLRRILALLLIPFRQVQRIRRAALLLFRQQFRPVLLARDVLRGRLLLRGDVGGRLAVVSDQLVAAGVAQTGLDQISGRRRRLGRLPAGPGG